MLKYVVYILLALDMKVKFTNNLTSAQYLGMFYVICYAYTLVIL